MASRLSSNSSGDDMEDGDPSDDDSENKAGGRPDSTDFG